MKHYTAVLVLQQVERGTIELDDTLEAFDTISAKLDLLRDAALLFEPGHDTRYSNYGYVVLGAILEKVTGRPFASLLHDDIFVPLGLNPPDSTERLSHECRRDRSRERRRRTGLLAPEAESRLAARNRPSRGCWRPLCRPPT
jgi:CubicO group peptidase (beta-lactamase class C family)